MVHVVQLSSEVEEEEFWLFELGEYFFGFVDLISEVDAAVVEALGVVDAGVLDDVAESAGRISPDEFGSVGTA